MLEVERLVDSTQLLVKKIFDQSPTRKVALNTLKTVFPSIPEEERAALTGLEEIRDAFSAQVASEIRELLQQGTEESLNKAYHMVATLRILLEEVGKKEEPEGLVPGPITEQKSCASAPHTVASVLDKTSRCILDLGHKPTGRWQLQNGPTERYLLDHLLELMQEAKYLESSGMIRSRCQVGGVDEVNEFLRSNGFGNIQLKPIDEGGVATASVFDALALWKRPAERELLVVRPNSDAYTKTVHAVYIDYDETILQSEGHKDPLVKLKTADDNLSVFITRYRGALDPKNSHAAHMEATRLAGLVWSSSEPYSGVVVPMADYTHVGKDPSILGARLDVVPHDGYIISQAICAHRFRLNDKGARAQASLAGTAISLTDLSVSSRPPRLEIKGPYLVWFAWETDHEVIIPFAAYIGVDNMKEPADLD